MQPWIIAFVILDLVVTTIVVWRILAKRAAASAEAGAATDAGVSIPDIRQLRQFTDAMHPRIGEIVRANWSGDAASLPGVLGLALDEAEREARNRDLRFDRDILKKLVEISLSKHRVARGVELREALKKVA